MEGSRTQAMWLLPCVLVLAASCGESSDAPPATGTSGSGGSSAGSSAAGSAAGGSSGTASGGSSSSAGKGGDGGGGATSGTAGTGGGGSGGVSGSEAMGGAGGVDDGAGGEGGAVDDGPWISSSRQVARLAGYQSAPQSYWEYLPPSYEAQGTPSPLLIFFHGIGENGDGSLEALNKVPVNGPPMVIETDRWPKERPFVVLSPQNASNCPTSSAIAALLTWAQSTYNLDANRLYLTGLSCGAIGISSYLANNVDTTSVAAAVVISGDMRSAWNAQGCDVGKVAIWGIHGDADANGGTQPDFTRLPMQSLIACPQPPRKNAVLNMIAGGTHSDNTWDTTYLGTNGLDVYGWLLDNAK